MRQAEKGVEGRMKTSSVLDGRGEGHAAVIYADYALKLLESYDDHRGHAYEDEDVCIVCPTPLIP